jgi:Holliday junction resolvase YEN1
VHSIYKEIGPGRRVALSKLAIEKYEETGRPLRIAIDTSIWLFQIQASKGECATALRKVP